MVQRNSKLLNSLLRRKARKRDRGNQRRPLLLESLEDRRLLATFSVTNTDDGGSGSLRQAIIGANTTPNDPVTSPDLIDFQIPGTGPHTIQPRTQLPPIDEAVIIDGYSQDGSQRNTVPLGGTNAVPMIELDGSQAAGSSGLIISARGSGSSISGLVINGFTFAGIYLNSSVNNMISGNFVGTDPSGMVSAPNGVGILIESGADNQVGGVAVGARNVIAGNTGSGVAVIEPLDVPTFGNSVLGNVIFANGQLGIDLANDGPTANDADDSDQGPNDLQNFPVLNNVTSDATSTTVDVTLQSQPATTFRLEFFANDTQDATGRAQGQRFLGSANVMTTAGGTANVSIVLAVPVPSGHFISATATNTTTFDTSEFSAAQVQPTNHNPMAVDDAITTDEDTAISGDVLAANPNTADSDPDGDTLTVDQLNGDAATIGTATMITSGALVTLNANGTFTYDPNGAFDALDFGIAGMDNFTYRISDGKGGTDAATVNLTITGLNDDPVAGDLSASAVEDGPAVTVPFNADDIDADDDPTTLDYSIILDPTEGSVTSIVGNTFTFDPGTDFQDLTVGQTRSVTFTYQAMDGQTALSNTATATITVIGVNDAPSFALGADPIVLEDDGAQTIMDFASSIDPGVGDNGQTLNFNVLVTGATDNLAFDVDPALSPSGTLTFTATDNTSGKATVEVTLLDDSGTSGPLAIDIPPTGGGSIISGETFTIDDGVNPLTTFEFNSDEAVSAGNVAILFSSVSTADEIANETVNAIVASGLALAPANVGGGRVLIAGSSDGVTVNVTLSPSVALFFGTGGVNTSVTQTFSINVTAVNDDPVLGAIGNKNVDEGVELTFVATATDLDIPAQNLTFTLDATSIANGMTIDGTTGAFSFTPAELQGGMTFNATITVTDDGPNEANLTDFETISITVNEVNVAPVLDPIGDKSVDELTTLSFLATASDVDDPANMLTFSLAGAVPAGAGITAAGAFSWTPTEAQGPGTFTFDVGVTDNGVPNFSRREMITVTVNEVNVAPVANPDTDDTTENAVVTTDVLANDTDVDDDDDPTNFSLDIVNINSTTGLLASPSAAGSVSIVGNQVAFDPGTDFDELDDGDTATVTINYTMSDDSGVASVSTLIITITGVNDGPVAFDDGYVALPGVPIMIDDSIGVLANDLDVDSDDTLTVELFSGPQHGELMMLNADGSFTYIAPVGTAATSDSFVYTVLDSAGASDQATVVIDIPRTSVALRPSQADPLLLDVVIEDLEPGGKNDNLSLTFENGELVITDNLNLIVDQTQTPPVVGQRIPIGNITGQNIIVNLSGGDDALDIDLSGLTGGGLDRSLTINGGGGDNDRLVFSGATSLGDGALTVAGNDVEEILVNGPITSNNAPVTLTAKRNLEVNADINTGAGGEVRLTASGHDIFGNCSLIHAGTADVHLVAGTGIAAVRIQTTGDVTLDGGSGGIVGCTGQLAVTAQTLTVTAGASVGTALLIAGQVTNVEPFRTSIDAVQGTIGGLGIFLLNDRPLTDNVVLVDAAPLGIRDIRFLPPNNAPEGEHSPLQNSLNRLDVNNDGAVSPVDVLGVVNYLNSAGAGVQSEGPGSKRVMLYVDVNGDYFASALDALLIINHLNTRTAAQPEGESTGSDRDRVANHHVERLLASGLLLAGPVPSERGLTAADRSVREPSKAVESGRPTSSEGHRTTANNGPVFRWTMPQGDEASPEWESLLDELAEDAAEALSAKI
ncbi:MAG: Ig-like domain-containing protein [Planctomycetota bacterium]|nr:Ig-like domain-containing protein [Planctomycetota bacterium]